MAITNINQTPDNHTTRSDVIDLFNDTRRRLVETGTRNRLVHVNRANTRGNVLNIVNERSDDVYAILSGGKAMRFLPIGRDKDDEADAIPLFDTKGENCEPGRYTDAQLEIRLGPDALQKKLLKIAREAQTAEEESGINLLYLALGFLTWFEDKASGLAREAPLVLLPVELVRNARTSTYDVRSRDEDILTNLPLQQRLKEDFGIDLPVLDAGEDWTPSRYRAEVEAVIAQHPRWKVDLDAIQLGLFSFSKLLMYRDLAVEAWPVGALEHHALTRGLLYEGFEAEAPLFGPHDQLDDELPPEKLFHVVDADASQAMVIEEVRSGRNLIVQGPPGTGKSQTITNIIATAAKEGKRVLFVAEKMAALSVVHDRLVKVGLRDVCLELHSRSANKKIVLNELARTLTQAATIPARPAPPIALKELRDRLNQLAEALHRQIGATGETAFSVLGRQVRFMGAECPPPNLSGEGLAWMSREDEAHLLRMVDHYATLLRAEGFSATHPFEGVRNLDLQPVELARLATNLEKASKAARELAIALQAPIDALRMHTPITIDAVAGITDLLDRIAGMPANASTVARAMLAAPDLARLREAINAGIAWRRTRDQFANTFVATAFEAAVADWREPLAAGARSFFARWRGGYRRASRAVAGLLQGKLPKAAASRLALVDALMTIAAQKAAWECEQDYCHSSLGEAWRGDKTDFLHLQNVVAWCSRLAEVWLAETWEDVLDLAARPDTVAAMRHALRQAEHASILNVMGILDLDLSLFGVEIPTHADLARVATCFEAMASDRDRYSSWAELKRLHDQLVASGVPALADRMRKGELDGQAAATEVRFSRAERLWRTALEQSPLLREIHREKRHDLVAAFAALERKRLSENVTDILASHLAQVPQGAMGEMKVVRGEIGKKRGHIALRKLFEKAGTALQRIKPVLLMSPISVAQFLPPGTLSFDLLVIDEASQVRPEDALGAIARAKQIVVVGDKKQLPPSSFFDRLLADDETDGDEETERDDLLGGAAKLGSMESILALCEARGLGSRMLKWHYRSRDPSLIEVSNREFYESGLVLPPSPLQMDPAYGLCFTRVEGVYDKGGKRDNRKEGEAIVSRVAEHARAHPTLSLGIVTFSFAQRNLITELLELKRRSDRILDTFLREDQSETLFVKNIENVQGDERDVVLISVGYGPVVPGGRLGSMSFGPVNAEGGERRLNVLFTRARMRCEVFASFDPGDIDASRARGEGPRILKRFLEFAQNGQTTESTPTGLDADTPFEEDVAQVIRGCGFLADPQVGSAGFRIDIGVRHQDKPGTYILAVECDGATYHSALWARERDRLRQDVLEHLGWRVHRIWSTDWFYNRRAEIERLRRALTASRDAAEEGIRIDGANRPRPVERTTAEETAFTNEAVEIVPRKMPAYKRAVFPIKSWQEPHEVEVSTLAELAGRIVADEGPIHVEEVARRIAACFGRDKAGSRILARTRLALTRAQSSILELRSDEEFWFTREQMDAPPVRDRSTESGATLKAAYISILEIKAALRIAVDDNAGGDEADLVRTTARLLGFKRVGSELQARIVSGL